MGSGSRTDVPLRRTAEDRITLPGRATALRGPAPWTGVPDVAGLVRSRLNRRLDEVATARIGVVVGPAGVGKTTALAHWARSTAADVVWWRARPEGRAPEEQAVDGLAHALHALAPRHPRATCRDSLLDRLQRCEGSPVVVIDDFDHVNHPDVGRLLERLVQGSDARLVVLSRTEPCLNLARSEMPSALVDMDDLRFREPETRELFATAYGEPLTEDEAWLLTRQTDGLAAVLHLFQQASRGHGHHARRHVLREFASGATPATRHVVREILDGLDPAELRLLRSTAPFETLTSARCSGLMGTESGPAFHGLVASGLLRRLRTGYALHRIVRRQLLDELREELGSARFVAHVRRCAAAMDAEGHPAAAVRAYVSVGDWRSAGDVLDREGRAVLADADLDWTEAPCARGPWQALGRAVRDLRAGRLPSALDRLGPEAPAGPAAVVELDGRIRRFVRLWAEDDVAPGAVWFERLRATVHRPDPLRYSRDPGSGREDVELRLLRAVECAVAGDLLTARRLAEVAPSDDLAVLCLSTLSALLGGPCPVDRLLDEAERRGVPWLVRLANALADPASRPQLLAEADASDDRWGALVLAGVHGVLRLRRGAPSAADFEDVVRRCRDLRAPALEAWARSGLALASAATGSPEAEREAELAVGFAHSAQVPGALAVAWGVLGTVRGDARLVDDATAEAERTGLGCRPWEWIAERTDPPGAGVVTERTAPVDVRCFGGFQVLVDGEAPSLDGVRPRARALLRMLALHAGTPVHRELLVDAMWPQLDASAGTHNLHVCISSLRAALEPGVARGASRLLVRDGDRYCLALPPGSLADLRDFDASTREAEECRTRGDLERSAAALEQALRLYDGDVLPEDGPSEWAVGVRDRYRVRAAEAAALLAELRLGEGRAEEGAAAAQRSIDIEPCRDGSWRLLIRAYEVADDLAAAERARRSYASVLASLGVVESTADLVRTARR